MVETITYYSTNQNVKREMAWLAYIILPNGRYWGVMFHGATEEEAKASALRVWNSEQTRLAKSPFVKSDSSPSDSPSAAKPTSDDPWTSGVKEHHFTGKVWMKNVETGKLARVPLTEVTMYERNNYVRSGPRSK